jgi:hypothetical protein
MIDHASDGRKLASCGAAILYEVWSGDLSSSEIETFNQSDGSQCNAFTIPVATENAVAAVDSHGNLWVAWFANYYGPSQSGGAYEFAPGSSVPSTSLSDPCCALPSGIAVGDDGTVYIANTTNNTGVQTNIEVYDPGATTPSRTLLPPTNFDELETVAVDRVGNAYAHYFNPASDKNGYLEWSKGTGSATDLNLPFTPGAWSLSTTRSGALLGCARGCYELNHGRVIRQFAVRRKVLASRASLRADEKLAFVQAGIGCGEWDYPRAGRPRRFFSISPAEVSGWAVSPAAPAGAPYQP